MLKARGFTLIELSIVLLIVGLIIAGAAQAFNLYITHKRFQETQTNLGQIHQALANFLGENGRLPCPAPLDAPANTPAYGNEDCSTSSGSIRVPGARDTAADANAAVDPILIGTIPTRTLSLPDYKMTDGYRHRFQYAVSESMTASFTYDKNYGVLNLIDAATPPNPVGAPNAGTYVVYSLGQRGLGGYSVNGVLGEACDLASKDAENCDNSNATFVRTDQRSTSDGPLYFDDIFDYVEPEADNIIPSGAVMAFDLAACPKGWTAEPNAAGRFVIGMGTLGPDTYSLRQAGGAARHTLTVAEMPSHTHPVQGRRAGVRYEMGVAQPMQDAWEVPTGGPDFVGFSVAATGGGQPHENRPPYVAYLYCRKD